MRKRRSRHPTIYLTFICILLLFYWLLSLRHLAIVPLVYEDEPWIASTAWEWATNGRFASPMFSGLYGMDEHTYTHLPLYPLILAAAYRLLGMSLWVSRLTTVCLGLLVLSLSYSLGRRLFGPMVGLGTAVILLFMRTTGATPIQLSGILLWDLARIARYDLMVPVFGLAALHLYKSTLNQPRFVFYLLIGMLAGGAGLSHIFGNFWLVALLILCWWQTRRWQPCLLILLGFSLIWLPYLAYVWPGRHDWLAQMTFHSDKLEIWRPGWYLSNLLQEYQRYGPGLNEAVTGLWRRPGFVAFICLVSVAIWQLGKASLRHNNRAAQILWVPLLTLPLLFALLITPKASRYLATVLPLMAVAMAWLVEQMWLKTKDKYSWGRWLLVMGLTAVMVEGTSRIYRLQTAVHTTTAYGQFISQIRAYIPADAHVLGLHNYWFGLDDRAYTTWVVPLQLASERPIQNVLSEINPDVVLWDERMEQGLAQRPALRSDIMAWLAQEGFETAVQLDDATYGRVEIWQRK